MKSELLGFRRTAVAGPTVEAGCNRVTARPPPLRRPTVREARKLFASMPSSRFVRTASRDVPGACARTRLLDG
jgi:hypothetical protein